MTRVQQPRGQILPLTAAMMVILIAMVGLAVDVGGAYLTQRWERSVADAAALAGAQDLQTPGTRNPPTATQYTTAQGRAMQVIVSQLGGTSTPAASGACLTSAGCPIPGTRYYAGIRTPVSSGGCVDCDPELAVQVTIRQPSFGLAFARVMGFDRWEVKASGVAGLAYTKRYGVVTLRPPRPRANGSDQNENDFSLTGGSVVSIRNGDVGTNTNLVLSGTASGTAVNLDPGYKVYHYDPYQAWGSPPPGSPITSLIQDPLYRIPQRADVPSTPQYTAADLGDAKLDPTACAAEKLKVPSQYQVEGASISALDPTRVVCYKPGIYTRQLTDTTNANASAILMMPGVYFFDRGVDTGGTMIGGYEGGRPGVAFVLPQCAVSSNCQFAMNNSALLALNFGNAYKNSGGDRATAATWNGSPVETTATPRATPILMSLLVNKDPNCYVAPTEPSNSCSTSNKTLVLPGNGNLWVAGVQYAVTDNVTVAGNRSTSTGVLGQLISWTITFNGGASLNLESAITEVNGTLRLDSACSPTVSTCAP